ncbi:MAG: hypothetical protein IPK82_01935 [Polyangiaceae bacterium]|nr:hypothetical protein [Polyangiaceae bacterium]
MAKTARVLIALLPGKKPGIFSETVTAPAPGAARFAPEAAPAPARKKAPAPIVLRIPPKYGARSARTLERFLALAVRDDVPGAPRVQTVKFLMTGVSGKSPKLYLIQTNTFSYHYDFAKEALKMPLSLNEFNAQTYFRDARENLAGTILYHESYVGPGGETGLFAIEFWPTDPIHVPHVVTAFRAISKALPFAKGRIFYHPAGSTQEAIYRAEFNELTKKNVRTILSAELFANITFAPMNLGVSFGTLRIINEGTSSRPPTVRDVVVLKQTPNDLSHVAGIVTEAPQTPLSHINLKAKQNGTPNAYLKNASTDPSIIAHADKVIRFEVAPEGVRIAAATPEEANAFLEKVRPKESQSPPRDLTRKTPAPLAEIAFGDARTFGAKTANLAELRKVLPAKTVPNGFGLPFYFYDTFMAENQLYEAAKQMIALPEFSADAESRDKALSAFRKKVRKAKMPSALSDQIAALQATFGQLFGPTQPIRARSSTNNEDLPGFNGAGLYDSYTHRPDEGHLENTVKQVFSSLWNFRAFEEREFYRIDHFAAAMGVLIHPNEDDELANGVAYTKNIYDPNWPGFYINAQVGESLVTNPPPGSAPEELLISRIGENGEYETQYISRSTLSPEGKPVLSPTDIERLVAALEKVHVHFAKRYGRSGDDTFAMDVEFKIRKDGSLQIKQARPTVD